MGVQIQGDTGNVIATKGTYSGDVSIGGTLTYEDVTNIDSVGLVTARNGIEIGARPGVAASISVDGNMIVSGISTFGGLSEFGSDVIFNADARIVDSIIHEGDTNTKIRFPAADTITAETGGSERVRINSDGDLLVGRTTTIDASEVLGIKGPDSEHCTFGVTSDGTTQAGIIAFNDDDATFRGRIQYNHTDDSMVFHTAGSERARIDSSGKITTPLGTSNRIGISDRTSGTGAGGSLLVTAGAARGSSQTTGNLLLAAGRGNNSADNGEIRFGYNDGSEGTGLDGEHARIGSDGNFALGGTNTSGYPGHANFFIGGISNLYADTAANSGSSVSLSNNAYIHSSGGWKYRVTGKATNIYHYNGVIGFRMAASGTAGNTISWDEKLRIANDGTITNTGSDSAPTSGSGFGFTEDQLYLSTAGTSANYALRFYNDNGLVGSVLVNGSSVTYNTSSDYRLKENQVSISDAISKVKQLKPYTFNFKSDSTTKIDGFFAHEAQEVVPHAVSGEKDDEQMQSMDYGKLTPLLTAALQESISEIETLKTEVAALKSQLNN